MSGAQELLIDVREFLMTKFRWGNIRRFPLISERNRTGGAGELEDAGFDAGVDSLSRRLLSLRLGQSFRSVLRLIQTRSVN